MMGSRPSNELVRVGVIGIGFGQAVHVPAFSSNAGCVVSAIAASDQARAHRVAQRLGVRRAFGDWRELVADPGVDVVSIAVPPSLQPEIAIAAAHHKKHLFCEKPAALTVEEATAMLDAAIQANVVHAIDFEFPDLGTWSRARSVIRHGGIGQLRRVYIDWRVQTASNAGPATRSAWKAAPALGGGLLGGFVSHCLYHVGWLTSSAIDRLRAFNNGGDADRSISIWATLSSGAVAIVTVASDMKNGSGHRIEVVGDEGTLRLENPSRDHGGPFSLSVNGVVLSVDECESRADQRVAAVSQVVRRFLSAIDGDREFHPNLADGARVQKLIQAVQAASAGDVWIYP